MIQNRQYIQELVIPAGQVEKRGFGILPDKELVSCYECGSHLVYIKKEFGIVAEENFFQVIGNKSKRVYSLRETGLVLYCAKCGTFIEEYSKWFYPEDKLVYHLDDRTNLDDDEKVEVEYCLAQYNQKREFEPRYKFMQLKSIKEALDNYEKKRPEKARKHKRKFGKSST